MYTGRIWIITLLLDFGILAVYVHVNFNTDLQNRTFPNPVLTTTANGHLHCAMLCFRIPCCITMTFNVKTGHCRCHKEAFSTDTVFTSEPATDTFQTDIQTGVNSYIWNSTLNLCLALKTDLQTHEGASEQCRKDSAHLASPKTYDELSALQVIARQYMNNAINVAIWTDGADPDGTGVFTYSDGLVISTDLWCPGEPNNVNERCVGLYCDYLLNDFSCEQLQMYMCVY